MRVLTNWRYYVIVALFATAFVALFHFAATAATVGSLMLSLAVAAGAMLALYRCIRHWERQGEIPEYTNQGTQG